MKWRIVENITESQSNIRFSVEYYHSKMWFSSKYFDTLEKAQKYFDEIKANNGSIFKVLDEFGE